ncbi:hypothetical protein RUND412_002606 [Rhizina undulata]
MAFLLTLAAISLLEYGADMGTGLMNTTSFIWQIIPLLLAIIIAIAFFCLTRSKEVGVTSIQINYRQPVKPPGDLKADQHEKVASLPCHINALPPSCQKGSKTKHASAGIFLGDFSVSVGNLSGSASSKRSDPFALILPPPSSVNIGLSPVKRIPPVVSPNRCVDSERRYKVGGSDKKLTQDIPVLLPPSPFDDEEDIWSTSSAEDENLFSLSEEEFFDEDFV